MRNSSDIKIPLAIQDPNIIFPTNCVELSPFIGKDSDNFVSE